MVSGRVDQGQGEAVIPGGHPWVCIMNVIRFYSETGEYGEFSNFAAYAVELDGKVWPTTGALLPGAEVCGDSARRGDPQGQKPPELPRGWAVTARTSPGEIGSPSSAASCTRR